MLVFKAEERTYAAYSVRCEQRSKTLYKATMDFVAYFIGLGDTKEQAEVKVATVSTIVNAMLYGYVLGNTQTLIDAINGIDEVAHPFMDAPAKAQLINSLTVTQ